MRRPLAIAFFALCVAPPLLAQADGVKLEAGVQIGTLDGRDALGEKPALAGGRAGLRVWRFVDIEAEVNRMPIGGGVANFHATEFLFGAKAGYRTGPFGIFATIRPGFLRYDNTNLNQPPLGIRPEINLGVALEAYSRHHIFVRVDFGDAIVDYGRADFGTRNQFRGTFGAGVWF